MATLLQSYKAQSLIFLFIWIVSMVLSAEFVLSVSMIALILLALFELRIEGPRVSLRLRESLGHDFQRFQSYRAWLWVSVPFLLVLCSWPWSYDLGYTLERLRIKLPFLALPFAFAVMPALRKREIYIILYFLLVMMSIISLYVSIHFLVNYEAVMADLGRGGHLPTPSNHIRFSLTLAIAIVGGLVLWAERFHLQRPSERWLIGGMTLFLFLFLHLLSVRSGVLALYLALLVLGLHAIISKKKYLVGALLVASVAALPFIAYHTLPSFKLKVDYARWDYLQYLQGKGKNYPDAERLVSMQIGLDIGHRSPLIGVGAGDLYREVRREYETHYAGQYEFRMPHNQLISVYAGTGLLGLALFLVGFFYPLFYRENYRNALFLALHAIVFMSFMMENTIENNFGVSMYLLFLLAGLNYTASGEEGILWREVEKK